MDLSPDDRDAVARTILSEAGARSAPGLAAVAHVIKNRTEAGGYGDSPRSVVMARGQFEPWSLPRRDANHPLNHSSESPEYQKAAAIADAVFSGRIPDPTRGSTLFYDPTVQSALGRKVPKWAQREPAASIGGHLFFPPEGQQPRDAPRRSIFEDAGFELPQQAAASVSEGGVKRSLFEDAGFELPKAGAATVTAKPPADLPPGAADVVRVPGIGPPAYVDAAGKFLPPEANPPTDVLRERAINLPGPGVGEDIASDFRSARSTFGQGIADIRSGLSAKGAGEAIWGAAGMPASLITGPIRSFIERPGAQVGGQEFGERAGALASVGVPSRAAGKAAVAALPSNRAINQLVDAIGPEKVPAAVERMRANPRLAPADVSENVRILTQGRVNPAEPRANEAVQEAVKRRTAEAPGAIESAFTEALGPAPDTQKVLADLKAKASKVGKEEIQPALNAAKPVDLTPVIAAIDKELWPAIQGMKSGVEMSPAQKELARLRVQLVSNKGEMLFDPQRLHEIQSENGKSAFDLFHSASGEDRRVAGKLRDVNEKLVDAIDSATGGKYRPARAKFAEAKDIDEAFQKGFDVLKTKQGYEGLASRPEALRDWLKTATPEQKAALELGMRSDVDGRVRGVRNQVGGAQAITTPEYNREKMAMVVGKDEADRLIRNIQDTADRAATNQRLVAQTKTAETLAGQKALEIPEVKGAKGAALPWYAYPVAGELGAHAIGLQPGLAGAALVGLRLGSEGAIRGWQKVAQMNALARNAAFARSALASGPAREELINRLVTHPKVVRALKKSGNQLTATP